MGAPDHWDAALKTLVPIVLASNQPMFVVWGERRTLLYNDAYAEILAGKHPQALGQDFLDVWHEIRDNLTPIVEAAYRGQPTQMGDIELWMERRGFREETHFSFFYSPVRADSGDVGGFLCACNEITAHVLTERRLAESEARHRGVLENMEEGFTLFDKDFNILEVNAVTMRLVNLPREELIGRNHWERFPNTYDSSLGCMYRQALEEGRSQTLQHRYRFVDGRACWFEVRAFPAGEGLAVVFQDVTERKKLEEEAQVSLERIQLALDAGAIVGTWVWNITEDCFIADERFAASFGLDAGQLKIGAPIEYAFDAIHPDDRSRVKEAVARSLEERGRYQCQYRVLRRGSYFWVEANGRVEVNQRGEPARFPGVLLDIEERRRVEAERDRAAALLKSFIQAVPGVVFAKDRQGRYLVANHGVAEALGVRHEEIIGRTDAELYPNSSQAVAVMALDREVMDTAASKQAEEAVTRADGTPSIWWSTKAPLRDTAGDVVGLVGTSVEITDRKRLEEELQLADRRKDEFLAMLAHELRNPLAPINASAHLLNLSPGDPQRVRTASEVISRQVGHLTRLVDDLLDVSRVTRGLVEIAREPVDLRLVVSTAVEQAKPLVQSRQHELRMRIGAGPFVVTGDFHRLVQVVSNLLNNAAKYTKQGGIIEIDLGIDIDNNRTVLDVKDNGLGIAPEALAEVFDLFTQGERTPDRSQGGLGIGLALVRSLVQLHGGDVLAISAGLQQGSTFRVSLPLSAQAQLQEPQKALAGTAAPVRVLVVDDNSDAASTLAELLHMMGHEVDTAHDGTSALAKAGAGRWDACILDIGLPDMTGYELTRRLRETEAAREATYIALTGYGQAQDRVLSKSSGFHHHLVKPADIGQVIDILAGSHTRT